MEQKYHKGDKVRVINIGSPWWESTGDGSDSKIYDRCPKAIGHVVEIVGSYNDLFPSKMSIHKLNEDSSVGEKVEQKQNGSIHYEIKWPEGIKLHIAWWYEYQLEPADTNTPREQQQHYPDYKESSIGKELKKVGDEIQMKIMWGK